MEQIGKVIQSVHGNAEVLVKRQGRAGRIVLPVRGVPFHKKRCLRRIWFMPDRAIL